MQVVAWTIGIHLGMEEFPGGIYFDFRKDYKHVDQRDDQAGIFQPKNPASPIRKNIPNREANDAEGQHLYRLRDVEKTSHHEH